MGETPKRVGRPPKPKKVVRGRGRPKKEDPNRELEIWEILGISEASWRRQEKERDRKVKESAEKRAKENWDKAVADGGVWVYEEDWENTSKKRKKGGPAVPPLMAIGKSFIPIDELDRASVESGFPRRKDEDQGNLRELTEHFKPHDIEKAFERHKNMNNQWQTAFFGWPSRQRQRAAIRNWEILKACLEEENRLGKRMGWLETKKFRNKARAEWDNNVRERKRERDRLRYHKKKAKQQEQE